MRTETFQQQESIGYKSSIVYILTSVLSLRSFNHEFTRFEKKHYPWSDL